MLSVQRRLGLVVIVTLPPGATCLVESVSLNPVAATAEAAHRAQTTTVSSRTDSLLRARPPAHREVMDDPALDNVNRP